MSLVPLLWNNVTLSDKTLRTSRTAGLSMEFIDMTAGASTTTWRSILSAGVQECGRYGHIYRKCPFGLNRTSRKFEKKFKFEKKNL